MTGPLPKRDGYIYAVTSDLMLIKLGFSGTLNGARTRIATVQTHHPGEIELVSVFRGGFYDEAELHGRFREHRKHGEWYADPDGAMNDALRAMNDPLAWALYWSRAEEGATVADLEQRLLVARRRLSVASTTVAALEDAVRILAQKAVES